jgi:hypothetical protein
MLGDRVKAALEACGITEAAVARLLGGSCGGCPERRAALNALDLWARRVLAGKKKNAVEHLSALIGYNKGV